MKTVTILLPAYNEEESFQEIKAAMSQVVEQNTGYNWEFLLINDGIGNGTEYLVALLVGKQSQLFAGTLHTFECICELHHTSYVRNSV